MKGMVISVTFRSFSSRGTDICWSITLWHYITLWKCAFCAVK